MSQSDLLAEAAPPRGRPAPSGLSAGSFLAIYCVLLLCIPSQLVVRQIGSTGTPANLWGIAGLIWWCCATLGGLNPVKGITPLRVTAGLLTAAVLASYVNGMSTGWYVPAGLHQQFDDVTSLLVPTIQAITSLSVSAANRGVIAFACWLGVVLLAGEGLRSWRDIDRLVAWLTWLAAGVAALGFLQYFWGIDIAGAFRIPGLSAHSQFGEVVNRSVLNRVSSTAIHPIEYGVALGIVFPLALHRTIANWGQRLVLPPTLLIGLGMLLSVSRSAVLVMGVSFLVLLIGWPPLWRRRALVATPFLLVATRAAFPGLLGTLYALFSNFNNDPSVSGRTQDYHVALSLYAQHPWLGRGMFTFLPVYYRILDNQLLVTLIELGMLGLLALLTFFLAGWLCARSAARFAVDVRNRRLGLSLSASIAGLVIGYGTFDAWTFPMVAGLTFLLIGLAHSVWRLADGETEGARALRRWRGVVWNGGSRAEP